MIGRYTLPEMAALWTDRSRFEHMLRVELAALDAVERAGLVPQGTTEIVGSKARVDVDRIAELEKVTDHDVIAFVSQVAETVGPEGRYLHLGLTSSDVVDTALALQLRDAGTLLLRDCDRLLATLIYVFVYTAWLKRRGGPSHLAARMTFSQPVPAQLTQTGELEAGRFRSMPLPRQWPHFNAGINTST